MTKRIFLGINLKLKCVKIAHNGFFCLRSLPIMKSRAFRKACRDQAVGITSLTGLQRASSQQENLLNFFEILIKVWEIVLFLFIFCATYSQIPIVTGGLRASSTVEAMACLCYGLLHWRHILYFFSDKGRWNIEWNFWNFCDVLICNQCWKFGDRLSFCVAYTSCWAVHLYFSCNCDYGSHMCQHFWRTIERLRSIQIFAISLCIVKVTVSRP